MADKATQMGGAWVKLVDLNETVAVTDADTVDVHALATSSQSGVATPALGQATMAGSMPVAIASDQSAVPITDNSGSLTVDAPAATPVPVRGYCDRFDVALSLDTNIYASGDLLADTQEIASVFVNSGPVVLYDIRVLDEDDQGTAIDILFLRSNTSLGTENLAYAPTDVMGREILKKVVVAAGDFVDEGLWRSAYKALTDGIGCVMKPTSGTSLWIAAVCRSGTPTYTAAGVRVQFGVIQQG